MRPKGGALFPDSCQPVLTEVSGLYEISLLTDMRISYHGFESSLGVLAVCSNNDDKLQKQMTI